jgi:BirA family biotin operon repressor/biotin-[acetyl-CoA-carboxylase] ligase
MKSTILKILRESDDVISGEQLSRKLSVSRVTVWKHIQALQALGYGIQSTPKGYRLKHSPEALFAWEFPGREDRIHYLTETTSTMDVAREMARKGIPAFTVVVAEQQKKGRGRLRRVWHSNRGGLYFTVILRPQLPPSLGYQVNFAASLCLAGVLRECYGIAADVKWPNDILVAEKKLVGMLAEMETDSDMITFINIGIGINVNNDPSNTEPTATSMKKILGRKIARRDLLEAFLSRFEKTLCESAFDTVLSGWKAHTITIGRNVRVETVNEIIEGRAVDVDEFGSLIVETADGNRKRVIYGDCFHE